MFVTCRTNRQSENAACRVENAAVKGQALYALQSLSGIGDFSS
jgi:hypothetical protein